MQSVSCRIWTRVVASIYYDHNHYTTGISNISFYKRSFVFRYSHTHIDKHIFIQPITPVIPLNWNHNTHKMKIYLQIDWFVFGIHTLWTSKSDPMNILILQAIATSGIDQRMHLNCWYSVGLVCWVGFYGISTIVGYLMPNPLYTYISNIYDLVWLGFLWHINDCRLFNSKSSLYIYIKYIWFGLVGFYGISTIVGYLMPNHLYIYIYIY